MEDNNTQNLTPVQVADTCTSATGHEPDENGKCKICGALNVGKKTEVQPIESKEIAKNEGGRPTIVTLETETKIESILKIGGTIEEATSYAGISPATYFRHVKSDIGFERKMEAAKSYSMIVAKNVIIDSIVKDKNLESARYWLDRHEFKDQKGGVTVNTQVNVENLTREQIENRLREILEHPEGGDGTTDGGGSETPTGEPVSVRQDAPKAMGSGYGEQTH
jgi:hypothetical protein